MICRGTPAAALAGSGPIGVGPVVGGPDGGRAGTAPGPVLFTSEHELSPEARVIIPKSECRRVMEKPEI